MIYQNLNLPATLVHSVNGKKYTLNGKLLAINESTKLATMQFGDKVSSNIPLSELYLNEASIKDIMKKVYNYAFQLVCVYILVLTIFSIFISSILFSYL